MKEDFSELVEYLDKKFEKTDQKIVELDKKFEKTDQKIVELEEGIKDIRSVMVTKEDFNDLQSSVDAYAKKADDYFQEMVALAHKVDRHEKWIQQIADKLGIKLEY